MDFSLHSKKVLFVVAPEQFRDEELADPKRAVESASGETAVASTKPGIATGMLGAKATPTMLVQDARAEDWDAVVVVGGMGSPEHLWNHTPLHALLREISAAGKVVGTICLSGAVAAKAGIARGKRATCWPDEAAVTALMEGGATYEKKPVVVDGNLVTADGPSSSKAFGEALVKAIAG